MWFEAIGLCGGKTTKWTSFPVRDAGDELVNALNCALEKKQITVPVATLVLDSVQPYQRGDKTIWGLNELNVWDKHQMLVPVLKLMHFANVRLEDEKGRPAGRLFYYMDESSRVRVDPMKSTDDRILTVKDKGKPSATILFDVGVPFEGEAVIPTLNRIAEEVTRTLEAFEALSLGNEG
jgi:hypothetical protein